MGTRRLRPGGRAAGNGAARLPGGFSRREFVLGAAALSTFLVGCARRTSDDATSETGTTGGTTTGTTTGTTGGSTGPAPAGPWSFTDDRGIEVALPEPPDTFAAFSTAAAALAEFGLTAAGIFAWVALDKDPQLRYLDLSGVETLGTTWPEINLEKLAAIGPDLVVTVYDSGDDSMYGFEDKKHVRTVEAIAPTLGIDGVQPLLDQIARWQELAVALGADVDAEEVQTNRDRFQAASDALAAAVSEKPGLKVMAIAPQPDIIYVPQVEITSDLGYYESLGVPLVHAQGEGIYYWEQLSWENAGKYPADVILLDVRGQRGGSLEAAIADIESIPTWQQLPAVRAGQIGPWHAFDPAGYRFYYEAMEEMTPVIQQAQVVA